MKILVAHTYYQQPGGEDTVFEQEVELLRRGGNMVVTYTRSNSEIDRYGTTDKLRLIPQTIWNTDTKNDFALTLDRERPDLVHFHNTFIVMSPSVYSACRERGIPVVQTLHNFRLACPAANFFRDGAPCERCLGHGPWEGVLRACYRNSHVASATVAGMIAFNRLRGTWTNLVDCFIVCSEFAREKFVRSGLPAAKILVKPNFVSPDPGPRTRTGAYALYVGRLSPEKGLRTLITAWKDLNGSLPLHIIGDGPLRSELEFLCRNEDIEGVHFLGHMPRKEVLSHIKSARFVVFPSECYENFPMTVVESYACGVPVIASRIGSTAEIVHDRITGLLFESGNPHDIFQKVNWAAAKPDLMEAMGRSARTEFEVKYSADRNYRLLIDIYQQALSTSKAPSVAASAVPLNAA